MNWILKYITFRISAVLLLFSSVVFGHTDDTWKGHSGELIEHYTEAHDPIPCHIHTYRYANGVERTFEWEDPNYTPPLSNPEPEPEPPKETNTDGHTTAPVVSLAESQATVPVGSTVGDSAVAVSSQGGSPPVVEVAPAVGIVPKSDIVLTQVMFHDWTSAGGGGLPQWFELHNRGSDGTVKDFQLTFFPKGGGKIIILLKDWALLSGETMIVARQGVGHFHGHLRGHAQGVEKVYVDAGIPNLKNNWVLTDPTGNQEIYRRDVRWNWGWGQHEQGPFGKGAYRKAVDVIPSAPYTGADPIYYGNRWDAGNPPGWHVDVILKAPPLVRPKLVTRWGALKQGKNK